MAYTGTYPNIQYTNTGGDIEIVNEVRYLLNEPVAGQFSDTQIQYWLDRGAVRAATLCKSAAINCPVNDPAFITLATSTNLYNLPSEMFAFADAGSMYDYEVEIDGIFVANVAAATPQTESAGWSLQRIHPRMIGHLQNTAGKPQYWCRLDESPYTGVHDHQIFIWPTPTSTYNNVIAELIYTIVPTVLKAADTGGADAQYLPEYLREDVIWYAVAEAMKRKKMYQQAVMYNAIFESTVMYHRQDLYEKPIDSFDMMKQPDFTQIQG